MRSTAAVLVLIGVLGACSQGQPSPELPGEETLTVFAAASLTEVFTELGAQFEGANPGATVTLSFGASSALAVQIAQDAPADVFASASDDSMQLAHSAEAVDEPVTFAQNTMEIAVPPDNPGEIAELADLTRPGMRVALCQSEVPCGAASEAVLSKAGLDVEPVTRERDVRAALARVQLGEVDAAIVYRTDVAAASPRVRGISIPREVNASTAYPLAVVSGTQHRELAERFVEMVVSEQGQTILNAHGFTAP